MMLFCNSEQIKSYHSHHLQKEDNIKDITHKNITCDKNILMMNKDIFISSSTDDN